MKLHKIFIICALVHSLPTWGAAAFVKNLFHKKPAASAAAPAENRASPGQAIEKDRISAQFYELVKKDDPRAQEFFDQNKAKINMNYQSVHGFTSLHQAAQHHNVLLTQSLLAHHADPNLPNQFKETALIRAYFHTPSLQSCDKAIQLTNVLIAAGTPINQQNTMAITALMAATSGGYSFALPTLLRHGADITIQAKDKKVKEHQFIPADTPFKDVFDIAHAYKQYAKTPEQWIIGHHMIKILTNHQNRTQGLVEALPADFPMDLIWLVGQYRGIKKKYSDY